MADYASSLPIRTENDGDAVVHIADGTTPSQHLAVNADGSINITDNSGSITVDAVDLDIRDLTSTSDSVEVLQSTHDDLNVNANMQVGDADVANGNPVPVSDAGGSLTVDATDLDIRNLTFATDTVDASGSTLGANSGVDIGDVTINNASGASAVNIQDGGNSITVDGSVTVSATDLDIRDLTHVTDSVKIGDGTDFLLVNGDGSINVKIDADLAGTEVVNYNTSASVVASASVNHDYTVSGGVTFIGEEAWVSASSKIKVQFLVNGATKFVGFNSTANPNIRIPLEHIVKAAATQVVRMTITNLDNQAQDVYSTLLGVES